MDQYSYIGIPGGEKREKGAENSFKEIMAENVYYLGKEIEIQIQEAQRVPRKNSNRPTPRFIMIKLSKVKTRTDS